MSNVRSILLFSQKEYYIKRFTSKDSRKAFLELLDEALKQQIWMRPIVTQEMKEEKEMQKYTSGGGIGIGGIKRNMEIQQQRDKKEITSAFSDLQSLKERA